MTRTAISVVGLLIALTLAGTGWGQGFTPSKEYFRNRGALLSRDVYRTDQERYQDPNGFQLVRRINRDGFQAALYRDRATGDYIVSYAGTESKSPIDWFANSSILAPPPAIDLSQIGPVAAFPQSSENQSGAVLDAYVEEAKNFYSESQEIAGGSPHITGHSLGGFLAQVVGSTEGAKTTTFNAPGVVAPLRDRYGVASSPSNVTNYGRAGDPVFNLNESHLGRRETVDGLDGWLENHSIQSIAEELEPGLSGYRAATDPKEYGATLKDLGISPQESGNSESPQSRTEPLPDESNSAIESNRPPAATESTRDRETPRSEDPGSAKPESAVSAGDNKTSAREAQVELDVFDTDEGVEYEVEDNFEGDPEESPRDPYENYRRYAADNEEAATAIDVADLEQHESSEPDQYLKNWEQDQARIDDELGSVDIGVWRLEEESDTTDVLMQLEEIAQGVDTERIEAEYRETLYQDRAAAREIDHQFAAIEQQHEARLAEQQQQFQEGLERAKRLAELTDSVNRTLESVENQRRSDSNGQFGARSTGGGAASCPAAKAERHRQVNAARTGVCRPTNSLCQQARCQVHLHEIENRFAHQCEAIGAADRTRLDRSLQHARRQGRAACRAVGVQF